MVPLSTFANCSASFAICSARRLPLRARASAIRLRPLALMSGTADEAHGGERPVGVTASASATAWSLIAYAAFIHRFSSAIAGSQRPQNRRADPGPAALTDFFYPNHLCGPAAVPGMALTASVTTVSDFSVSLISANASAISIKFVPSHECLPEPPPRLKNSV